MVSAEIIFKQLLRENEKCSIKQGDTTPLLGKQPGRLVEKEGMKSKSNCYNFNISHLDIL